MCCSREPLGASAFSGATSAWGNITPESEVLKMLLAAMWQPVTQALPQVQVPASDDPFAAMNSLIASLEATRSGIRKRR